MNEKTPKKTSRARQLRLPAATIAISLLLASCSGDPAPKPGPGPSPVDPAATIVGKDSDGSGVRDDVQAIIAKEYSGVRAEWATSYAKTMQASMERMLDRSTPVSPAESMALVDMQLKASTCLLYATPGNDTGTVERILASTLNTQARIDAMHKALSASADAVFTLPDPADCAAPAGSRMPAQMSAQGVNNDALASYAWYLLWGKAPYLTGNASAAGCQMPAREDVVAFVNGIFTDSTNGMTGAAYLAKALKEKRPGTTVRLYWNPGGNGANMTDLMQTIANKLIQEGAMFDVSLKGPLYEALLHMIFGDNVPAGEFTQAQRDRMIEAINTDPRFTRIVQDENGIATVDSVQNSTDRTVKKLRYDLSQGNRVTLMTHSQGNFYGKEAFRIIGASNPELLPSMAMQGAASVTRSIGGGGRYVTYSNDLVVRGVSLVDPKTLPYNHGEGFLTQAKLLWADPVGHSLERIYLNPQGQMRERLVRETIDALNATSYPAPPKAALTVRAIWKNAGDVDLLVDEPVSGGGRRIVSPGGKGSGYIAQDDTSGNGPETYGLGCGSDDPNVVEGDYFFKLRLGKGTSGSLTSPPDNVANVSVDLNGNVAMAMYNIALGSAKEDRTTAGRDLKMGVRVTRAGGKLQIAPLGN